jgi:hypothetical protein
MLKRKVGLLVTVFIICFAFIFIKEIRAEGNYNYGDTVCGSSFSSDLRMKNNVLWRCNNKNDSCSTNTNLWWDQVTGSSCTSTNTGTNTGTGISANNSSYNPSCTTASGKQGMNTALGCVPIEIKDFIPWLMTWFFGMAGGIAFLLMVYGFILIATSSGDEKKAQAAKETITSAIVGLLVCIFAVFILRLIAVNILQIPGIN